MMGIDSLKRHPPTKQEEQQLEDSRMGGHERDGVPAKKAKRLCKNLTKWEETYPYLMKGNVGPSHP